MNIFKYIWYKLKEFFTPRQDETTHLLNSKANKDALLESIKQLKEGKVIYKNPASLKNDLEKSTMLHELMTLEHAAKELRESSNKPKRQYNRATKQQVNRIKLLVGRGKSAKQIAQDVGLPYDNVNYYVKKFGG